MFFSSVFWCLLLYATFCLSFYSFSTVSQCVNILNVFKIHTYPASYIQFNFIMFVDFTPEIINSAPCGETINFAGLWHILKTLMKLLLMYLAQIIQYFKTTPVLFHPPFFSFFCMIYVYALYNKSSWFCIYTLKQCLAFVYCSNTTKL